MRALNKFALLAFVLVFASAAFLFIQLNASQTGQFTLLLACNQNGSCNPGETYANCPQDCCSAQCTACTDPNCTTTDGICHSECYVPGTQCSVFRSACNGLAWGTTTCYSSTATVQCCSGQPQDCTSGKFCSSGSCANCSTVCNDSCQSSACYGIDPDCDILGNATQACCGNLTCDAGENCTNCSADCPGSVVCSSNAQCDDSNALTVDVCNNPGQCNSSCSNTPCTIACDSNAICNDSNPITIDVCLNPGTCSASCSNTPCPITCDSNSACNDSNSLTTDTCNNPGTCSASCSYASCAVVCSTNAQCDDSNPLTVDSCVNTGTCSAYCSNSTCTIACSSNAGCDDANAMTADTCNNAGTCSASCSHVACAVACSSDSQCDDGNENTSDTCNNAGTCDASCSNEEIIATCSSDADCDDGNPNTADSCYRAGTPGAHCVNEVIEEEEPEITIECNTDADCDDNDPNTADSCYRAGTPGARCLHEPGAGPAGAALSIEFVRTVSESERAVEVEILVRVLDSAQQPVTGATVSITDAKGNSIELTSLLGGQYGGRVNIGADYPLGEQSFTVIASKEGQSAQDSFNINVKKAPIAIEVLSPMLMQQAVGATVDFRVKLTYPDASAVEDANVLANVKGEQIALASQGEGSYTFSYALRNEHLGTLEFNISAADQFGNDGSKIVSLQVLTQEEFVWFIAGLLFMLLSLLIILMLILLFYMRFEHILRLERQRAKYLLMKKKAELTITTASPEKKKELMDKAAYLDKLVKENEASLKLMRKRSWLTLGDIPMDLYFTAKAIIFDITHLPSILRGKKRKIESVAKIKEIDSQINDLQELIKKLENDFYKQLIAPDDFKRKLFDYREKIHILEIGKKKLG